MPATILDSMIFRDIFTTAEMRQVFSDENRTTCYLEIEAALARVQGRLGIIGFVCMRLGFPLAPMLLGYVLGPMMEENLRRSMLMSGGDATVFVRQPISLAFIIATAVILVVMVLPAVRKRRGEITG